jgi:SAM-dependent methyltransferase
MTADADSLERLIPEALRPGDATGLATLDLHLERYAFAARHLRPGRLLDLACGVGYGTKLLRERGPAGITALGIDLSEEAVAHARRHYVAAGVSFERADAMRFSDAEGFDSIVSLETIEHLPDPAGFVDRLVGLLRPGGMIVASAPTTPSVDVNPHHLHDFSERSFRRLFGRRGLREEDALLQVQPFSLGSALRRDEARMRDLRPRLGSWYLRHPGSLLRRVGATLRFGPENRYLTVAWRREDRP